MTKLEQRKYYKQWREKNLKKIKEYRKKFKEYYKNYRLKHKDEAKKYAELWRKNNPEKCKEYSRKTGLKSLYGITLEEYNRIFLKQNGMCSICGIHHKKCKRSLHVDHNHSTGNNRGLLCPNCNHFIGWIEQNPNIVDRAEAYLKQWKS